MQNPVRKWSICGLLFLATLVNYLDRQTISVSASNIAAELHLTDAGLGELFFGFLFAYGVGQLFIGPWLDRLGTVAAYAIAVAAWSLAGAASGLASTFGFLMLTRILLGVCESPNWLLALRVVARVFPPEQRSLANGVFQSGTSLGATLAPPLIIYLTASYGWRACFFIVGGVGLGWIALWLAWFRHAPEPQLDLPPTPASAEHEAGTATRRVGTTTPASLAEFFRSRAFWGLVVATSFLNPLQYFYTTWLPRYFDKYAGVSFGKELAHRLIVVYLALDLGLWTGGALVAVLARRVGVRRARLFVTAIGACCMATVPLVSQLRGIDAITAVICVATFGLGWFMVNYLAFTSEVSATKVSTAAGLLGGTGSLAGAGFMLLVGGSIERSGGFAIAFLMAGVMPLIALGGIWFSTRGAHTGERVAASAT